MPLVALFGENMSDHVFGGPYKGCRCAVCMVRKRKMTAAQIKRLPPKPKKDVPGRIL